MKISGNTVLITGGTSGIGLAFAEQFYKAGSKVIVCGRRRERLEQISEQYPGMIAKRCDITDDKQRQDLYDWTIKNYPDVNVFVNNAGVQLDTDLTQPVDLGRVRSEVETNFIAPLHLASLFAQHLSTRSNAVIINVSSGLAFVPLAFMPVYCATKAAIHSLTLSMRYQLRDKNVKVIEIIPPSTDTELGYDRWAGKAESHGGLPIAEFIKEAMDMLENDVLEAPVAESKRLREKRDEMFNIMNK